MNSDRCRKVELIIDDVYKFLALGNDNTRYYSTKNKIKNRIQNLSEDEFRSFVANIVEMEHTDLDVFRGNITHGDIVEVVKPMALTNRQALRVYEIAQKKYQNKFDRIKSHSLINRMIKVNKSKKLITSMAGEYANVYADVTENRALSREALQQSRNRLDKATSLSRLLMYFDDRELDDLKSKCARYDARHNTELVNLLDLVVNNPMDIVRKRDEYFSRPNIK